MVNNTLLNSRVIIEFGRKVLTDYNLRSRMSMVR